MSLPSHEVLPVAVGLSAVVWVDRRNRRITGATESRHSNRLSCNNRSICCSDQVIPATKFNKASRRQVHSAIRICMITALRWFRARHGSSGSADSLEVKFDLPAFLVDRRNRGCPEARGIGDQGAVAVGGGSVVTGERNGGTPAFLAEGVMAEGEVSHCARRIGATTPRPRNATRDPALVGRAGAKT